MLWKNQKKLLTVNELKVCMISAMKIKSGSRILVAKGVPITKSAIAKLKDSYFSNEIEVYTEEENYINSNYQKRTKTIEEVEKDFVELSFNVQQIFKDMEHLQTSSMEEVRKFAARIKE